MNMDQALLEFFAESRALAQELEATLLRSESSGVDADAINGMFRAAHTIKGSAGLFGLDAIVAFTHVVENVLDRVRGNAMPLDSALAGVLLECVDHINTLVDTAEKGANASDDGLRAHGERLTARLRGYLGKEAAQSTSAPATPPANMTPGDPATDPWHIAVRFKPDALRNGMDPASFIRYLATKGEIVELTTLLDALPAAAEFNPENCYLGFEIQYVTVADKRAIESVFEFVRGDCDLRIQPPPSHLGRHIEAITRVEGNLERLGEILLDAGVLTDAELRVALETQQLASSTSRVTPPLGEILVGQGLVSKPAVDAALEKQKQLREHKTQETRFVRVQADKLDRLINLVGELVIASSSTSLLALRSGDAKLHESSNVISRLVEEIRDDALRLRMVEIGETFNRFPRVVRDVSKELGKDIELVISGGETELDKSVVERIGDPLMHLVRNAIDHGIESAHVRAERGKPAKGTLRLNAYHDSGSIVIEVSDDGGGLNKEKIRTKAVERGLIQAEQRLSDHEIYQLIFEPGFSTADAVTNLSGRGVGMDVVRRNIQALRGTTEIDSTEGAGTMVRIRLPLTLAIIDGFLVGVGESSFVIPLDMVVECMELSRRQQQEAGMHQYINLRGEVLPFIRLRNMFEIDGDANRRENVVVVQYAGHKAGLVVDQLLGEFQTVIKPLGKLFQHLKGLSGSTILGGGEVALILDIPTLVQHAATLEAPQVVARGRESALA